MGHDDVSGEAVAAAAGMEYLSAVPAQVPEGRVLVHNVEAVGPNRAFGSNGFRAWLAEPSDRSEPCGCSWAPGIGEHYRTARGS